VESATAAVAALRSPGKGRAPSNTVLDEDFLDEIARTPRPTDPAAAAPHVNGSEASSDWGDQDSVSIDRAPVVMDG